MSLAVSSSVARLAQVQPPTGVARTAGDDHPEPRRHHVEALRHVPRVKSEGRLSPNTATFRSLYMPGNGLLLFQISRAIRQISSAPF